MDRNSCLAALSLRPALLALLCTEGCYSQTSSSRPLGACREMRPQPARRKLLAATPTAFHPRSRRPSTLNLQGPPSSLHVAGGRRPLRAYCEMPAHIAPSELGAATPTAFHPRPSWAPDEIECRVLLKLRYTNPTSALATSLRHTMTAERQNRVVALRKVDILAAAQTDRHVGGASRMAGVIEQPVFGRGFLQLFHFYGCLERKPAFPSSLACPRINRRRIPRGVGAGDFV
jgi:hypothetical protein